MSNIEWTDETWNPTIGCSKISPGCKNCYAARDHNRHLHNESQVDYTEPFNVVKELQHRLSIPYSWKKPRRVFVNSMSDLFHKDISFEFVDKVFSVMHDTPRHHYQILTKRPDRIVEFETWYAKKYDHESSNPWTENIWMGTTIESQDYVVRAKYLIQTTAHIKFLSCEPLIGELDLSEYIANLDWVIAGGESIQGYKHDRHREVNPDWIRKIRDQCIDADVPFLFKQYGNMRDPGTGKMLSKKKTGRMLDGREWNEFPVELEVVR